MKTSTKVIASFLVGASVAGGVATATTNEVAGVKVCVDKRSQAIYLANSNGCSSTRTAMTLGAPTIDVKSIASLVTPSVVSIKVVAAAVVVAVGYINQIGHPHSSSQITM
jgi:energy-converting hydrogenase Eha subunit B